MMGSLPPEQNALFYDFCLEKHIPKNHLLRHINQFLDFDRVREYLEPFYSHTGRPSIDPELMIRMLLVGYCYGIRSERRLCEEVNFNLAYRWFCHLGLEDEVPNHSSFSKNRLGRFRDSDVFRCVFNMIVERCISAGLVKGEGFAIDASFVEADVSRQRAVDNATAASWVPDQTESRAVREYLEALDEHPELRRRQKSVSLTDPMAQWTAAKGPTTFSYSTNYVIDIENNIILDVEASPSARSLEVKTTQTMIDRIEETHGIKPRRLMGDTAYGAAENLTWSTRKVLSRTYLSGINQSVAMARYLPVTSNGMTTLKNTVVLQIKHYGVTTVTSKSREKALPKLTPLSIVPVKPIAIFAD